MHQDMARAVESVPAKRNVEICAKISASESRVETSDDRFDLTTGPASASANKESGVGTD